MTQQQAIQLFLPVLIILPVLYLRMRKMTKAQPLKLGRLWIRPALILLAAGLVVFLPQPGQPRNQVRASPMTKSELILRLAERNPHLYQRDVERIVSTVFDEITGALARGDRVELR